MCCIYYAHGPLSSLSYNPHVCNYAYANTNACFFMRVEIVSLALCYWQVTSLGRMRPIRVSAQLLLVVLCGCVFVECMHKSIPCAV